MRLHVCARVGSFRRLAAAAVLFPLFFWCENSGPAQSWLPDSGFELNHTVAPVCVNANFEPAAIFRADRVFTDYQRRGFFRIGALPFVAIEGLSVEVLDASRLTNALSGISAQFASKGDVKKAVEGRDLSLWLASEKENRLLARRVRLENGAAWRLQDGTFNRGGEVCLRFHSALLVTTGARAGELTCETMAGTVRTNLLSLLSDSNH